MGFRIKNEEDDFRAFCEIRTDLQNRCDELELDEEEKLSLFLHRYQYDRRWYLPEIIKQLKTWGTYG